jgi:hypothetical protein
MATFTKFLSAGTLLLAAVGSFAGEKPDQTEDWPRRGDTVYVSATLAHWEANMHFFGVASSGHRESEIPACVPMEIRKAKPGNEVWITKDPVGGRERLHGPWLPKMHKTESECREALDRDGEPQIVRNGWIHQIIPKEEQD